MRLELDWVVGTIRIGGDNFKGAQPGTRYDFVCSVIRKGDEAYLYAAHGTLNREVFTKIKHALRDIGVLRITYERLNTEKLRQREVMTNE